MVGERENFKKQFFVTNEICQGVPKESDKVTIGFNVPCLGVMAYSLEKIFGPVHYFEIGT